MLLTVMPLGAHDSQSLSLFLGNELVAELVRLVLSPRRVSSTPLLGHRSIPLGKRGYTWLTPNVAGFRVDDFYIVLKRFVNEIMVVCVGPPFADGRRVRPNASYVWFGTCKCCKPDFSECGNVVQDDFLDFEGV